MVAKTRIVPRNEKPFVFRTGDVQILVTYHNENLIGKVSSDALFLVSPVLLKFLFPPWLTFSQSTHPLGSIAEIDCSANDGDVLLILLNIAHLNFNDVPTTLSYDALYQLAILVDQYQCIPFVKPRLELWIAGEEMQSLASCQEGWLFISWVFGREEGFEALARKLMSIA
jgi:hypothetical protein